MSALCPRNRGLSQPHSVEQETFRTAETDIVSAADDGTNLAIPGGPVTEGRGEGTLSWRVNNSGDRFFCFVMMSLSATPNVLCPCLALMKPLHFDKNNSCRKTVLFLSRDTPGKKMICFNDGAAVNP